MRGFTFSEQQTWDSFFWGRSQLWCVLSQFIPFMCAAFRKLCPWQHGVMHWLSLPLHLPLLQVMYFSSLFPYVVLFCFLVRGLFLKGAVDGIAHMFTPKVRAETALVNKKINHSYIYWGKSSHSVRTEQIEQTEDDVTWSTVDLCRVFSLKWQMVSSSSPPPVPFTFTDRKCHLDVMSEFSLYLPLVANMQSWS